MSTPGRTTDSSSALVNTGAARSRRALRHRDILSRAHSTSSHAMPAPHPAAVFQVSVTVAVTNMTKAPRCVVSLWQVDASSTPATSSSTPSTVLGKAPSSGPRLEPNSSPSKIFIPPKKSMAMPERAPKRCWPARPPAPWQHGMTPNQQPTRFIAPTDVATSRGGAARPLAPYSDSLSSQTLTTELRIVSGSCGTAARTKPRHQSERLGTCIAGSLGPSCSASVTSVPPFASAMITPTTASTSAAGTVAPLLVRAPDAGGGAGRGVGSPRVLASASAPTTGLSPGGLEFSPAALVPAIAAPPSVAAVALAAPGKTAATAKTTANAPTSSPSASTHGFQSPLSSYKLELSPRRASETPRPSCMPRTIVRGVWRAMTPMRPLTPSANTMAPVRMPAASASSRETPSAIAMAAMDFIGCTGMGILKAKAVSTW
mmetsp:Transcript_105/g.363  ORF Transcript_105/g.363 Transcript_105/m.363 type:complete len:430 (-) Transcript_105:180-1469(-)